MRRSSADFADEKSVKEDENDFDVVIVGAGLAGLTCAYNILKRKAGLQVLIIEANKEIGGRILSKDCNETFHGNSSQKHITDLMRTLHIQTQRQNNDAITRILYTKYGPLHSLSSFYGAEVHSFLRMMEMNTLDPRLSTCTEHEDAAQLSETSVEQLLRRMIIFPRARSICRAFICSTCATRNLNEVSSLWLLVLLNGAFGFFNRLRVALGDSNRFFVEGGMTKIAQELLKRIVQHQGKIRYVEPVNQVMYNDDRAYVLTEKTYYKCEYVVLAVPPPMQSDIVVKPPLECFLNAPATYAPLENVFFNVTYKKSDLNNDSVTDIVTTWDSTTNLNILYNATHSESEEFLFAGFLAEPHATQTRGKGVFDTLNECFGTTEALNYKKYKECDLIRCNYLSSSDQTSAGSPMSVMKPTSISNYVDCIDVTSDRIFVASSEYASNWPGTIDGAIEVGESTAYSILSKLRPQALTFDDHNIASKQKVQPRGVPFKMSAMQYLGLTLNVAVFLSFLRHAYDYT